MAERVVEVRDVAFGYNGGPKVLEGANLLVNRGDYVAVLGPNGGGKSTLLKILLGVLTPQAGTVRVLGGDPRDKGSRLGYMPQYAKARKGMPMKVIDVALMGLLGETGRGFRFSRKERDRAMAALDRVGVAHLADRSITDLSGGQRQRAFIARALVSEPEILFLDEPTASVDAQGRCSLLELLVELNRDMTIIYVSHDLSVVASGAHSVACVNHSVHFHSRPEVTREMLHMMYGAGEGTCPVEMIMHGDVPHRVVPHHGEDGCCPDGEPGGHEHV